MNQRASVLSTSTALRNPARARSHGCHTVTVLANPHRPSPNTPEERCNVDEPMLEGNLLVRGPSQPLTCYQLHPHHCKRRERQNDRSRRRGPDALGDGIGTVPCARPSPTRCEKHACSRRRGAQEPAGGLGRLGAAWIPARPTPEGCVTGTGVRSESALG